MLGHLRERDAVARARHWTPLPAGRACLPVLPRRLVSSAKPDDLQCDLSGKGLMHDESGLSGA